MTWNSISLTKDDERLLLDFAETMERQARETDVDLRGDVYDALVQGYRRRAEKARDLAARIATWVAADQKYRSWPENAAIVAMRTADREAGGPQDVQSASPGASSKETP